eukprot:9503855-Pyramimonas_sp.AAC.1
MNADDHRKEKENQHSFERELLLEQIIKLTMSSNDDSLSVGFKPTSLDSLSSFLFHQTHHSLSFFLMKEN